MEKKLLPSGLYDLLPPFARQQSDLVSRLLVCFSSFGYEEVSPPLIEFEGTLFSERGEALAAQTFRVMDPLSQEMMGFRPDMTLQIGRIATTRLANAPRPLRLCYAGPVLRVKAEQLRNERQLYQAGVELIGAMEPAADAEVMLVAAEALQALGVNSITIDLNLPGMLDALIGPSGVSTAQRESIIQAARRKDVGALAQLPQNIRDTLSGLMLASGPAEFFLKKIKTLSLSAAAQAQCQELEAVLSLLKGAMPSVTFTVDALEMQGFEYHTGISFSIFAEGIKAEIGRGGRYTLQASGNNQSNLLATGFTLYVETIQRSLSPRDDSKRVYVPAGVSAQESKKLRADGMATILGLSNAENNEKEARRLRCSYIYINGKLQPLT